MSRPPKKPTRAATQARLEAVSDAAVGPNTAIDAAFAAVEASIHDPQAMRRAQARLRALLQPDANLAGPE